MKDLSTKSSWVRIKMIAIGRHLQKRTALHKVDKLLRTLQNAAVDGSIDRFAAQAELYARTRPKYPQALLDLIDQSVHHHELAVDVGTGSGQLAVPLSSYFHNVLVLDKSPSQLSRVPKKSNIYPETGVATSLPASNSSVDLVTAAQCYHWFLADQSDEQFLKEAYRVLRPDGRLAILGYGICSFHKEHSLQTAFEGFYYHALGSCYPPSSPKCWWDIDRRLLDKQLEGVVFPLFRQIHRVSLVERRDMTLGKFYDYIESFSAYQTIKAQLKEHEADPLEELRDEMGILAGGSDTVVTIEYPFFCILLAPN